MIISLGIAIFTLFLVIKPDSTVSLNQERSLIVQTVMADPQTHAPILTLYGKIETPALVQATAPKKSWVESINVREGDFIKPGELLLTLDARDFKPKLIQAKAKATELVALIQSEKSRYKTDKESFVYEQAILELEKSAVKRARKLKNKKLGSAVELEQAQAKLKLQQLSIGKRLLSLGNHDSRLDQLKSRLTYAKADVDLAQLNLERSKIIAPFAGIIEKLSTAVGDQVDDNKILLTFYATEQLQVRAKIPAPYQAEIQQSLSNKKHLQATANYFGTPLKLTLDRVSGIADARGIDVLLNITTSNLSIRPGSSIRISLQRPKQNNVLILPYTALYNNNTIYRIVDNRLDSVKVTIAGDFFANNQEKLLIFSPKIQAGDRIMITHLPNAIKGLKVSYAAKD